MSEFSVPVFDEKAKSLGDVKVSKEIFGADVVEAAVHYAVKGQLFHYRKRTATTKGRSDVSGGGKKARKQKGGGCSRQGGNRAPQWVGGGVVFGPQGEDRKFKINKKVRKLALTSVLSDKLASGEIRVIKSGIETPKTKIVSDFLNKLKLESARVGFVVSNSKQDVALGKSIRNLNKTDLLTMEKWTVLDFLKTDSLVFTEEAFNALQKSFDASVKVEAKNSEGAQA